MINFHEFLKVITKADPPNVVATKEEIIDFKIKHFVPDAFN